jgi:hypothetical protein
MQKDDFVIGATVFSWGNFGGAWEDFDVAGTNVSKKLITYTQANPAQPFDYSRFSGGGDVIAKKPRGHPRAQYERVYVLLPSKADAAWARAVVEGAWSEKRYTIGSSADDAGIGDLNARCVIAVNPQKWPGPLSLEDFFKKYYPGVTYKPVTAATPAELAEKLTNE